MRADGPGDLATLRIDQNGYRQTSGMKASEKLALSVEVRREASGAIIQQECLRLRHVSGRDSDREDDQAEDRRFLGEAR